MVAGSIPAQSISLNKIREFAQKIPTGYLAGYFVKVIRGFIQNVPTGHIGGYFVNEIRGFI